MSDDVSQAQPLHETSLRQRLRDALVVAMKERDRVTVTALRSTLAAIDNAEAVDATAVGSGALTVELSPVGVGAAEAERRVLSDEDIAEIVRSEVADREAAAREYDLAGRSDRAEALRAEARVISSQL